jgi:hypothetical protein
MNIGVFCLFERLKDSDVTIQLGICYWFLVVGVAICFHSNTSAGVYSLMSIPKFTLSILDGTMESPSGMDSRMAHTRYSEYIAQYCDLI